jgi:hypothetical protein
MGTGGTPEGIIAAAAVRAAGGAMQAMLDPQSEKERRAVLAAGYVTGHPNGARDGRVTGASGTGSRECPDSGFGLVSQPIPWQVVVSVLGVR